MQLKTLIDGIDDLIVVRSGSAISIQGVALDFRKVQSGFLFAALPGLKCDGLSFVADAIAAGAVAVLVPEGCQVDDDRITVLQSKRPRRTFAKIVSAFYGRQPETIVAVTGTNGKSSTVHFCRQIWQMMGCEAASLGTLGLTTSRAHHDGALTTPDPVTLHAQIAKLEEDGVTHLALEASSQGMDQYRLDGLRVTAAGFTNVTRDHLDYHGSMEAYIAAKTRLFSELLIDEGVAVVNADSPVAPEIYAICEKRGVRVIDYGAKAKDIVLEQWGPLPSGQSVVLNVFGTQYTLQLPLVGAFQIENALCALGLVLASDRDNVLMSGEGARVLERLQSVRGRLEYSGALPHGAAVYVDYAHTPDGLETMLKALRPHTEKKLHVVFGCGGDRDKGKRPMMGEVAVRLADHVIVTDDNPRTEDAAVVRSEIMQAAPEATEIGDRRAAIRTAIKGLESGDVLVIAGKGHEQGQIVGTDVLPFDDVTEVKKILAESM